MPMEEQVVSIYAATPQEGRPSWVRNYPVEELQRYERELLEFLRTRHGDVLEAIRKTGKLEEDVERKLAAALDEFAGIFQVDAQGRSAA
jgi:F-type H+-transporting ATPase subunit alpha